jgi:hypothetical protein
LKSKTAKVSVDESEAPAVCALHCAGKDEDKNIWKVMHDKACVAARVNLLRI